jgi:hypothetical protein
MKCLNTQFSPKYALSNQTAFLCDSYLRILVQLCAKH